METDTVQPQTPTESASFPLRIAQGQLGRKSDEVNRWLTLMPQDRNLACFQNLSFRILPFGD